MAGTTRPTPPAAPGRLPEIRYGLQSAPPAAPPPPAPRYTATPAVIDGDTLAVGPERLRINGIDAPEMAQSCERRGATYPCGAMARDAMAAILGNGRLSCEALDTDRFGRRIVRCRNAAGVDIGAEMVRQGWAIAYRRFSLDYVAQEEEARAARRGLWEGRFEAPWEWRAQHR